MLKPLISLMCLSLFSSTAWTAPDQLDVIGIIPGVSTEKQVRSLGVTGEVCATGVGCDFHIGEYRLLCVMEFENGILWEFSCMFGEEMYSKDLEGDRFASNNEVFMVLEKGFREKFGRPSDSRNNKVSNKLGVDFTQHYVEWVDKKGNELFIIDMFDKTDRGIFLMRSFQKLQKRQQEIDAKDKKRRF